MRLACVPSHGRKVTAHLPSARSNAKRFVLTSSNRTSTARARFARNIWNCYAVAAWNSMNVTFNSTLLQGLGMFYILAIRLLFSLGYFPYYHSGLRVAIY